MNQTLPVVINESQFTPEQMKLITDVVAKGATKDELALFLHRCRSMNLDPLKPGQIYFIKYGSGPGTIVVGIDGFRTKAQRTGQLTGIKRGVIRNEKGECVGAFAEVYRKDWVQPAREEVPMNEYNTGKGNWSKMPETMIKKVAEAAALRMAFPDDLGGIYTQEEMDQASRAGVVAPEQPEEGEGREYTGPYLIDFGKFRGRTLEQVGPDELRSYINYIETKAEKDGKPIVGKVADFIERASDFIAEFETMNPENNSDL
jgi:phage recombination protein Bet